MPFEKTLVALFFLCLSVTGYSQRIVYSEPSNEDNRRMNFEIMGKVSGNFLVYKNNRNKNFITVYNNNMEELSREELSFIPDERLINIEFFPYNDHVYVLYQFQKKNVVYCDAVKINGSGKKISDVTTLDTTHIRSSASNKVYSAISSENKQRIMLFKVNSRDRSRFVITTILFDDQLNPQKKGRFTLPMHEDDDFIDKFSLDNDGDLAFVKFNRNNNETINSSTLLWKPANADTVMAIAIPHENILLDDIHLKVDNSNKRYFISSFYYAKKRGNIEGFYFYVWDKQSKDAVLHNAVTLGDDIRREAKGDANIKMAFNDYFVRNVIIKKDGGFLINTEAYYTSSRGGGWNRWNYMYGMPLTTWDYYNWGSPLYNSWMWRDRFNSTTNMRRHADNIAILSFDNTGKLEWSNVIHKEQFDDESDDRISFVTANRGNQIHYLFNVDERRGLFLNDYTLSPEGAINHNPTLKNLERGYEFLPKYGKQVSSNQVLIPCFYRNYICFAKIEFN